MLQSAGNLWSLQINHINNGTSSLPLKMEGEIPITNPVRDYITLPAQYGKVDLRIYNSNGQLIKILKQQAEKAYVGNLKNGHYLVLINWQEMDEVLDFRMIKI